MHEMLDNMGCLKILRRPKREGAKRLAQTPKLLHHIEIRNPHQTM